MNVRVEHHAPDELLLEYAAGASEQAVALVLACHATLCLGCRARIHELEAVGGALLELDPRAPTVNDQPTIERRVAAVLARADALDMSSDAPVAPTRLATTASTVLPAPLLRYTGPYEQLHWRKVLPGVHTVALPLRLRNTPVRLKRVKAGLRVPPHRHAGMELDLVLAGGLRDLSRGTQYERGDLQLSDREIAHELQTLAGEDCVVLSVNEARMQPLGLRSKLLHWLMGW